ncbi:MAG TPA: hypothetical protein VGB30_11460 [bacterium]|jgi:HEAT repeat protein
MISKLHKYIDMYVVAVVGILIVCAIYAGRTVTPGSMIEWLDKSQDLEFWVSSMTYPDRSVRNYASDNIVDKFPGDELGGIAIQMTSSDDPRERLIGLGLLGKTNLDNAGDYAINFLDSSDVKEINLALAILVNDPHPQVRERLLEILQGGESSLELNALKALGKLANPQDLSLYINYLPTPNVNLRDAASEALIRMAPFSDQVVPSLLGSAFGSNLTSKRAAIHVLGEIGDESSLDSLFSLLITGDPALATDVVKALGAIGGEETSRKAYDLFMSGDTRARRGAARVLGEIGVPEAAGDLWAAVEDRTNEIFLRLNSMVALARCGNQDIAVKILELLHDRSEDPRIVRSGIESLGGIQPDFLFDVYDSIIRGDEDFGLNQRGGNTALLSVAVGLGYVDSDESRSRLRSFLDDNSVDRLELLMGTVRSLGKVGTADDIAVLSAAKDELPLLTNVVDSAIREIESRYST